MPAIPHKITQDTAVTKDADSISIKSRIASAVEMAAKLAEEAAPTTEETACLIRKIYVLVDSDEVRSLVKLKSKAITSAWQIFIASNLRSSSTPQPALVLATVCAMEAFAENKQRAEVQAAIDEVKGLSDKMKEFAGRQAIHFFRDEFNQSARDFNIMLISRS